MKIKESRGWCDPDMSSDLPNITSELQAEMKKVGTAGSATLRRMRMKRKGVRSNRWFRDYLPRPITDGAFFIARKENKRLEKTFVFTRAYTNKNGSLESDNGRGADGFYE